MKRRRVRRARIELDRHQLCALFCLLEFAPHARDKIDLSGATWLELSRTRATLAAALERAASEKPRRDRQSNSPK